VPVIELSNLNAAQRRAYLIADNQTALRAGWDLAPLKLELMELRGAGFDLTPLGFDPIELGALLGTGGHTGLTDPDAAPDAPENPVATSGDLWALGKHWLLCGDARKAEDTPRRCCAELLRTSWLQTRRMASTTTLIGETELIAFTDRKIRTCKVFNMHSKGQLKWNEQTQNWVSQEGPFGECGTININILETDKAVNMGGRGSGSSSPFWIYTQKRLFTNPSGVLPNGLACSKFTEHTARLSGRLCTAGNFSSRVFTSDIAFQSGSVFWNGPVRTSLNSRSKARSRPANGTKVSPPPLTIGGVGVGGGVGEIGGASAALTSSIDARSQIGGNGAC
jgi:hypothetical protein